MNPWTIIGWILITVFIMSFLLGIVSVAYVARGTLAELKRTASDLKVGLVTGGVVAWNEAKSGNDWRRLSIRQPGGLFRVQVIGSEHGHDPDTQYLMTEEGLRSLARKERWYIVENQPVSEMEVH